jgi:hypothetical protein
VGGVSGAMGVPSSREGRCACVCCRGAEQFVGQQCLWVFTWACPTLVRAHSPFLRVAVFQFFPTYRRFDAGDIKGFTLLISVRNDQRPLYQLCLVRTNGNMVQMESAPSYVFPRTPRVLVYECLCAQEAAPSARCHP